MVKFSDREKKILEELTKCSGIKVADFWRKFEPFDKDAYNVFVKRLKPYGILVYKSVNNKGFFDINHEGLDELLLEVQANV